MTVQNVGNARWIMLGLLWLAYVSFGLITGTIAPLVDPMMDDLQMTYSQMGLVLGAWQLIYIVTAIPLGTLIDRIGVKKAISVGISLIWLSLVLRGIAVNFSTLFLAVALFGFGGPIISIGAPKVVALWFRGSERGLAAGIYTTAPIIGLAISLLASPTWILQLTGTWRGTSLIFGTFVFVVFLFWIFLAKENPKEENLPKIASPPVSRMEIFKKMVFLRNMQIMLVVAILSFFLNHGLNNWLPTILVDKGKSIADAGSLTAIGTAIGAIGLLVIPRIATFGRRRMTLGVLLSFSALTTYGLARTIRRFLRLLVIISGLVRSPLMPICTLILMETPGIGAAAMGQAGGLFFAAAEIGGFCGPLILGLLRDITGSLYMGLILLSFTSASLLFFLPWIREKPALDIK